MSTIDEILEELREIQSRLHALTKEAVLASEEDNNLKTLGDAIYEADGAKRAAAGLYSQLEAVGLAQLPYEFKLEGGASLTRRESTPRKTWRHKELGAEVAHRIYASGFDFETGEMLKSTEELILELMKYAGIQYWKVKQLDKIGIAADKYCETGDPKSSIQISHPK